ncbi:MAG: Holliday junction branch migration protein RuvA [Proteobacteria bacterium]|nr:Holliday junction branch migration protein RuvA [Pseudomonadota bacterium]
MIGKLRGRVDETDDESVILDVGGVGYHVFCSSRTLAALPAEGEMAQLTIETHVREDHFHLYGFPDSVEREWFRLLATVQRVGNKMALSLLGAYTPQQLAHAILAKDTAAFSRISGVGPKLAERIVTELKDKVAKLPTSSFQPTGNLPPVEAPKGKKGKAAAPAAEPDTTTDDAISALVNLGYSRSEAYSATLKAAQNAKGKTALDDLIRLSLKELVRG